VTIAPLYIQNASTTVTDAQVQAMTRAAAYQARWQFAPVWNQLPTPVLFLDKSTKPAAGAQVIAVLDDPDQAGALGYHSEGSDGVAYGRVFAKPSLDNGSGVFTGEYAVSATLSHEVLEFIADPNVSYWASADQDQTGFPLYAFEVADAVEGDSYAVRDVKTDILVSNFVLPVYFDPQNTKGPWDYLRRLTGPFTIGKGGYAVTWTAEKGQQQIYGREMPTWRQELKQHDMSRGGRRVGIRPKT
jgi:hypothetical protein